MLYYEVSQIFVSLGLQKKEIHRVLEFIESQWLKPFVEFITQKEIEAEKMNTKRKKRCTN